MTTQSKTEGYPNSNESAERINITCPTLSNNAYNFRSSQITKSTLSTAFGIPSSMDFFLVDEQSNIEFPSNDGSFDLNVNTKYQVHITKQQVHEEQKVQRNIINDLSGKSMNISVAGNEDDRTTAMRFFMSVHGSMNRDKRDGASVYVIAHSDQNKKGIWILHPFKSNDNYNLCTIQFSRAWDNRAVGRGHWLAVHGTSHKDKRDDASLYVLITSEAHKATIWEIVPSNNNYYIRVFGNKDGRKTAVGYLLAVHASSKNDKRDGASFVLHARTNDHKATEWRIQSIHTGISNQ